MKPGNCLKPTACTSHFIASLHLKENNSTPPPFSLWVMT